MSEPLLLPLGPREVVDLQELFEEKLEELADLIDSSPDPKGPVNIIRRERSERLDRLWQKLHLLRRNQKRHEDAIASLPQHLPRLIPRAMRRTLALPND